MATANPNSISVPRPNQVSASSLRESFDASPYPLLKINRNWRISYANRAAINLFLNKAELVGEIYWEIFSNQIHLESTWREQHHLVMESDSLRQLVQYFGPPLPAWMDVTISSVSDGIIVSLRDAVREKQAMDSLTKMDRLASLGRLNSAIAHEIRNPLESVPNLLYLAQRCQKIEEVQDYLLSAERELGRASLIASQTLRFNRISEKYSVIKIDELIREVLLLHKARLQSGNIEIDLSALGPIKALCNEGEIRQILNNLVANAADSMSPQGGRLLLRTRTAMPKTLRGALVTIADSGTGMSRQTLMKIFDPFFTTKAEHGNGLGLWISREIAGRHNGTLKANPVRTWDIQALFFNCFSLMLRRTEVAKKQRPLSEV